MIVGTAGHIDHGKTTLVKALTGVDTDRLPEEKRRGISIALGYAFLDAGDGLRIGFIDVPGHERLVHTMLAGATGIDLALLLVAADDGVMPQTREHLAVLALLGIAGGAVVITKCDRVPAERIEAVGREAAALVAGTPLEDAPRFAVAAAAPGDPGTAQLRAWLVEQARSAAPRGDDGRVFRLAIDRAFTLDGAGTVVTGTVHAGRVAVGDELLRVPGGDRPLRVRSLHAQNRAVAEARAGERCAVALAGTTKTDFARGDWLVAPAAARATERLDARLRLWPAESRALRSGTPVHLHLGAADVMASVAVLEPGIDAIEPGASARVQLVLRAPIGAWRGDRVVLRDASASRTLAGGRVLDPAAPARYRRTPERLAELAAAELEAPAARLVAGLDAAAHGIDLDAHAAIEGCAPGALPPLPAGALRGGTSALASARVAALGEAVVATLAQCHAEAPDQLGPDAARLRRRVAPRLALPLWQALVERLRAEGRIARRGSFLHLPEHGVQLSADEARIAARVAAPLAAAGHAGAWVRDLAGEAGEPEATMRATLARLAQRGELHQVVRDLYYPHDTMGRLAAIARRLAQHGGAIEAAAFRDATGLGRKRAIQVLEYLDRIGLTRRIGDRHRLRPDTALFDEAPPPPG